MNNLKIGFILAFSSQIFISSVFSTTLASENKQQKLNSTTKPVEQPPKVQKGNIAQSDITITETKDTLVKEYRIGGILRAIKVTPKNGTAAYYLVDREGTGEFVRLGPDMGKEIQPPQWILFEW